ncbi:extracellular solute-binding protein [Craurococcus roseus]|uniref:Extracellular solute-binding protein n=1 Tax=Craurococcus roseus TaxID=77585 RepID=A0ABP3Q9K3_9PROT
MPDAAQSSTEERSLARLLAAPRNAIAEVPICWVVTAAEDGSAGQYYGVAMPANRARRRQEAKVDDEANHTTLRDANSDASRNGGHVPRAQDSIRSPRPIAGDRARLGGQAEAGAGRAAAEARIGPTRRAALLGGAAVVAAGALPAPSVHGQTTGGRLSVGFWDHWVPPANEVMRRIVAEWGEKNHVEVQLDLITSVGNKLLLTVTSEAQARRGHDVLTFGAWGVRDYSHLLEPVDEVMGRLVQQHGPANPTAEYLAKGEGGWRAVPATSGTQYKGSAARMDLMRQHAGIDVQAMYPAEPRLGPDADQWTWETFLTAARKCNAAGVPFALPAGTFTDATDWIGAMFRCFGADLVDARGNITVRGNDRVGQILDYAARLFQHIPNEMFAADDATNNRALIGGRSALIFNPPSAWAVAKRDAPQVAEQTWHFPSPKGPVGQFVPHQPLFWGIWSFSRAKPAAKALLEHLSQREQVAKMVAGSEGYDIPPFASLTDFDTWSTVGPPRGTVFNYPLRPHHGAMPSIACEPAPPEIGVRMYQQGVQARMIARLVQNKEPMDRVLAWAEREIEGFKRG